MQVLFIDCSEKNHKAINSIVNYLSDYFDQLNIINSKISISKLKITKCTQCRCCTIKQSNTPVKCATKDDMSYVIDAIENANCYVILADRNSLFKRNAIHQKFSQRLVSYYYWPYTQAQASLREPIQYKNSILINLNTTKYFMNHSFYTSKLYMEGTSYSIGAKVQDWVALHPKKKLIESYEDRLKQMAYRLISSFNKKAS